MPWKREDLTGQKFNKLTAIKLVEDIPYKSAKWLFLCECGNEKIIQTGSVKFGSTKSCGCAKKNSHPVLTNRALARPKGQAGADILWSELKGAARRRNKEFSLTKENIFNLCSKDCFYCNAAPYQISEVNNKYNGLATTQAHGRFIFNALDRVDNNKGYIIDNVVPCCPTCNFAKRTLTLEQFYLWIKNLHTNLLKKGIFNGKS